MQVVLGDLTARSARSRGHRLALHFPDRLACGRVHALAAVLSQKANQVIHMFDFGPIVHKPSFLAGRHQASVRQLLEMEGECRAS